MPPRPRPTVVLLSAPGTLEGVDPLLRRAGVRAVRLASQEARAVDRSHWLERLARAPKPDTVVVTSRTGVEFGVRPWRNVSRRIIPVPEFWAVGPGTAQALRRAGLRRVHRPSTVGASAVAAALDRRRPRMVVYFRSDRAGPGLARALRDRGHSVVDLVVYRLEAPAPLSARDRRELARAKLLVVTSPSGLSELRRRLEGRAFLRMRETTRLVLLGERSRRAARAHGFRSLSVAPSTTAQRFTQHLLRELRDARS